MYDAKATLETRAVTFEGLDHYSNREKITSGHIFDTLNRAMWQVHNHIKHTSDLVVQGGQFFFKIDSNERPNLLFATSIRTDRPIRQLNGYKQLGLGLLTISNAIN